MVFSHFESSVRTFDKISRTKKEVQGDISYAIVRNEKLTRAEVNRKETKKYFDECYKFICNYKNLGKKI